MHSIVFASVEGGAQLPAGIFPAHSCVRHFA
jgi:hypothetical protein